MAQRKRDLRQEARGRELLTRQPKSGLTIRAFCLREQVTESGFYAWRRELRLRGQEQAVAQPAFVPVTLAPGRSAVCDEQIGVGDEQIIIELRGGRVLRFRGTDTSCSNDLITVVVTPSTVVSFAPEVNRVLIGTTFSAARNYRKSGFHCRISKDEITLEPLPNTPGNNGISRAHDAVTSSMRIGRLGIVTNL